MLIIIDNYDSFTYNIVQYLGELGADIQVFRNDEISMSDLTKLNASHIVISPGPCTPNEAGISMDVVRHFSGKIPILGVCLGHQSIGQVFGGHVIRARKVMHGKLSPVYHKNKSVFKGLPNPVIVTRYHSLIVDWSTLPSALEVTSWTQHADGANDEIMGFKHRTMRIEGVQFHPESVMTEHGHELLANFLHGS